MMVRIFLEIGETKDFVILDDIQSWEIFECCECLLIAGIEDSIVDINL